MIEGTCGYAVNIAFETGRPGDRWCGQVMSAGSKTLRFDSVYIGVTVQLYLHPHHSPLPQSPVRSVLQRSHISENMPVSSKATHLTPDDMLYYTIHLLSSMAAATLLFFASWLDPNVLGKNDDDIADSAPATNSGSSLPKSSVLVRGTPKGKDKKTQEPCGEFLKRWQLWYGISLFFCIGSHHISGH